MENIFDGLITEKKYMKLKEGDNRFRILKEPIVGWLDWNEKKPYRYRKNKKPSMPFDASKPIKAFLACYVWDYAASDLFVLELTQATVLKSLKSLLESEDWGDFREYDIKIKRSGSGADTKYLVEPCPHKALGSNVKAAMSARPVNLEALFEGGDPWSGTVLEARGSIRESASISEDPFETIVDSGANKDPFDIIPQMTPLEELREHLSLEELPTHRLEEWLSTRAKTENKPVDEVIKWCLAREILPRFKRAFAKYITPPTVEA